MLKKRLAGVITVKDGWAVQSFGYRRYLPLGRPECLAENLDRWGIDEIIVLSIDRTRRHAGPDFALVRRLGGLGLLTPVAYGGGIRSASDAGKVIEAGAERVCLDALLRRDRGEVSAVAALVGSQAVIGVLPLSAQAGRLFWHDYLSRADDELSAGDLSPFTDGIVSEALIIDRIHEGGPHPFDESLVDGFPTGVPLIAFGGLHDPEQIGRVFAHERVVACAVGNPFSYREHAVQHLRRALPASEIRDPQFRMD